MLILTRCPGDKIRIGDSIEIVVLDVVGQQVRLGIHAPREIAIDREELYRSKHGLSADTERVA
jgi:carbon storage regulator